MYIHIAFSLYFGSCVAFSACFGFASHAFSESVAATTSNQPLSVNVCPSLLPFGSCKATEYTIKDIEKK